MTLHMKAILFGANLLFNIFNFIGVSTDIVWNIFYINPYNEKNNKEYFNGDIILIKNLHTNLDTDIYDIENNETQIELKTCSGSGSGSGIGTRMFSLRKPMGIKVTNLVLINDRYKKISKTIYPVANSPDCKNLEPHEPLLF